MSGQGQSQMPSFGNQNPMAGQGFNYQNAQQQAMQRGAGMMPRPGGMGMNQQPGMAYGGTGPSMVPPPMQPPPYGVDPREAGGFGQQPGARQMPNTPIGIGDPTMPSQSGSRVGTPVIPTGNYLPDGSYGGTNGPQTPEAIADMQQNHPVLYALRQKLIAQGQVPGGLLGV